MKFINTKMWFSHKLEQDNKDEEIVELTQADVLKTIDLKVPSKNIKENTQPMNELSNQIDTIVTAICYWYLKRSRRKNRSTKNRNCR